MYMGHKRRGQQIVETGLATFARSYTYNTGQFSGGIQVDVFRIEKTLLPPDLCDSSNLSSFIMHARLLNFSNYTQGRILGY